MDIQQKPISDIFPYEKNAKKHTQKQVEQIAASIREFGFNQPIVVDKTGTIIVGHGRYEASKVLGLEVVPTVTVDLTEERARAYRLADNRLNESDWDMTFLMEELHDLDLKGYDIELTGFDKKFLNKDEVDAPPPEVNVSTRATPKCTVCGEKVMCETCDNENL